MKLFIYFHSSIILVRTALLAFIGFMPTQSAGALGALEYPPEERRRLALL